MDLLEEFFENPKKFKEYKTNKLLWNINYYIQNIHKEQDKQEANELAYFLTFFVFWNQIKAQTK